MLACDFMEASYDANDMREEREKKQGRGKGN